MNSIDIKLNKDIVISFINKDSTQKFNKFSNIDILLKNNNEIIQVFKDDYLQEALDNILGGFKRVIDGKLIFPEQYNFNKGIFYYNQLYMKSLDDNAQDLKIDFPKSDPTEKVTWLLSTNGGYQTFLYLYKNDVYLEVTKSHEYMFDENDNIDNNSFNEWIKNYSIDYRFKLTKAEAETFLKNLEINFNSLI